MWEKWNNPWVCWFNENNNRQIIIDWLLEWETEFCLHKERFLDITPTKLSEISICYQRIRVWLIPRVLFLSAYCELNKPPLTAAFLSLRVFHTHGIFILMFVYAHFREYTPINPIKHSKQQLKVDSLTQPNGSCRRIRPIRMMPQLEALCEVDKQWKVCNEWICPQNKTITSVSTPSSHLSLTHFGFVVVKFICCICHSKAHHYLGSMVSWTHHASLNELSCMLKILYYICCLWKKYCITDDIKTMKRNYRSSLN